MKGDLNEEERIYSSILDIISGYSVNEGMNDFLLADEGYLGIQKEMAEQIEQFKLLGLTKDQRLVVDRLITSHTESGAYYGRMTYKRGFQDCVALLQEIGLIKAALSERYTVN